MDETTGTTTNIYRWDNTTAGSVPFGYVRYWIYIPVEEGWGWMK